MDPNNNETFEAKINRLAGSVSRDDSGKLVMPDDLDEATQYALRAEVRRRDTQSALSKEREESTRLRNVNKEMASAWQKEAVNALPENERERLDELKNTNPDEWRNELNKLAAKQEDEFSTRIKELETNATKQTELEVRTTILEEYNERYPNVLTDDNLNEHVPVGYIRRLEKGELTYVEFLDKCVDYLTKNKVVGGNGDEAPGTKDLGEAGGGGTPSDADKSKGDSDDYKNFVC